MVSTNTSTASVHEPDVGSEENAIQLDEVSAGAAEDDVAHLEEDPFPRSDVLALVPPHPLMDGGLFEKIYYCQAHETLTEQEKELTDDGILRMETKPLRLLCKKCQYFFHGNTQVKRVSTTGKKPEMQSRLLAWFHLFRQQQAGGNERQFSFTTVWSAAEDARLVEIISNPMYQSQLKFLYQVAPWRALDEADGSPVVSVWRLVVAVAYNNFVKNVLTYRGQMILF